MKKGKKFRQALGKLESNKLHTPQEAFLLVKELSFAKFDETVELHVRLGVDPRHADQQLRGTVSLPHGTGKQTRVLVFAKGEKEKEAKEAGADFVGAEELADRIEKENFLEFDVAIATPDMMKVVSRLGKILGPRGLMPNPKVGTVTMDVGKTVRDFKKGKVEYRTDKFGNIHVPLGRVSFNPEQLEDNFATVMDELVKNKPAAAKGKYLKSITVVSTMGPGVKIDPATLTGGRS